MKLSIKTSDGRYLQVIDIAKLDDNDELVVEDKWGRKWRLMPINNKSIEQPFTIHPIAP